MDVQWIRGALAGALTLLLMGCGALEGSDTNEAPEYPRYSDEAEAEYRRRRAAILEEAASLPVGHWAGAYSSSVLRLTVAPQGGFVFEAVTCPGPAGRNYGGVTETESGLRFHPEYDLDDGWPWALADGVRFVRWGRRRHLVAHSRMMHFCNTVNQGSHTGSLVHTEDAGLTPEGRPDVPGEYRGYLLDEPIDAEVVSVGDPEQVQRRLTTYMQVPVALDVGWEQGVLVGMEFLTEYPVYVEVTEVHERSCRGLARLQTQEGTIEVGTPASTRLAFLR